MIVLKKFKNNDRMCNCCESRSVDDVVLIDYFNDGNFATQIAICDSCLRELSTVINGYLDGGAKNV